MDVVQEWPAAGREVTEVHTERDTDPIGTGHSRDRALDVATRIRRVIELNGREGSSVFNSWRIVLNDRGVAKDSSNHGIVGLRADKTQKGSHQD